MDVQVENQGLRTTCRQGIGLREVSGRSCRKVCYETRMPRNRCERMSWVRDQRVPRPGLFEPVFLGRIHILSFVTRRSHLDSTAKNVCIRLHVIRPLFIVYINRSLRFMIRHLIRYDILWPFLTFPFLNCHRLLLHLLQFHSGRKTGTRHAISTE